MKKEVLKELTAKPGKEHHVSDFNPSFTADMSKQDAKEQLVQNIEKLSELQSMLYAQDRYSVYKRQNKLFHFHKTFCSEFDIINTKQNVHFTKVVSPIFQFCLSLHQFSIGAKVPFINKRD